MGLGNFKSISPLEHRIASIMASGARRASAVKQGRAVEHADGSRSLVDGDGCLATPELVSDAEADSAACHEGDAS
jgi:hypothetical protein